MNKKANKKNLAGRFLVAEFFVLLFSFSLLMVSPAQALTNVYNKQATSTLTAVEWNNLLTDFISINGGRIDGPLSINTATSSSYALDIVGSIRATNLSGSFSGFVGSSNVSAGAFGSNTGLGNYSFPANVGIGTTNTGSRLLVYDDVAQSPRDANTALRIETPNASGAPGTTGGQITFAQPYLTGNAAIIRTGAVRGIKTLASGNYGGGLQLLYAPIGDVDMAAGLTLNHLGNVGIGTTTPTEALEVVGNLKLTNQLFSAQPVTFESETSVGLRVTNNYGYVSITPLNSGTAHIYTDRASFHFNKPIYSTASKFSAYSTGNLQLQTAGTTRIIAMAATGNVGINIANPLSQFTVKGSGDTSTTSALDVQGNDGVSHLFVRDDGNVGIGTTTPAYTLDIQNTNAAAAGSLILNLKTPSVNGARFILESTSANGRKYAFGNNFIFGQGEFGIYDYTANTTGFLETSASDIGIGGNITSSALAGATLVAKGTGNVGIGTTTPTTARLVVTPSGNYSIDALGGRIGNISSSLDTDAASVAYVKAVIAGTSTIPTVGYWTVNGAHIYNANTGGVAINTTTPGIYKLNVNGDTNITGALNVTGAITATTFSGSYAGTINSANVSAGNFAANTGLGNFSFPGNVGIGTTNPNIGKLESWSDSYPLVLRNAAGGKGMTFGYVSSTNTFKIFSDYYDAGPEPNFVFGTYSNQSNQMVFATSGNVGIGTTNPRTKTEFNSGLPTSIPTYTNTTNGIAVTDGGAIYGRIGVAQIAGAGYPTYIQAGDFQGAAYYNLLLNPLGGNVGINTTDPGAYKLNVNGNTNITGTLTATSFSGSYSGTINAPNVSAGEFAANTGGGNFIFGATVAGNVGIGTTTPTQGRLVSVGTAAVGPYVGLNDNSKKIFEVTYGGARDGVLELFKNDATNTVYFNSNGSSYLTGGNVGIGTTTPGAKFDVLGTIRSTTGGLEIGKFGVASNPRLSVGLDNSAFSASAIVNGWGNSSNPGISVGTTRNDGTAFSVVTGVTMDANYMPSTAGATALIVLGTGNVGIGTTTPTTAKLVINPGGLTYAIDAGGARIGPITSSLDTDAASVAYVKAVIAGTSTIPTVGYWTVNGTNISNTNSGNVGIGTTDSSRAKLVISGMVGNTTAIFGQGNAGVALIASSPEIGFNAYFNGGYKSIVAGGSSMIDGTSDMTFSTGSTSASADQTVTMTPRMTIINSTGNVGINTTTPGAYRLNVNGDTNITGNINVTGTITGGGAYVGTINAGNVSAGAFASNTGLGNFSFPGNVGIGTAGPNAKLDILAQESTDTVFLRAGKTGASTENTFWGFNVAGNNNAFIGSAYNNAANRFGIRVAGTDVAHEWVSVLGNGNVGIGTTGPLAKFEVVGPSQVNNDRSSHFELSTGTGLVTDEKLVFGVHDGDYSWIQAVKQATAYRNLALNPNGGNVGIGTAGPAVKLSNTSTRLSNADGLSSHLSGFNWEVNGQGQAAVISNVSVATGNHNGGLLVKLASADATDKILDLESGGVNRVRVLGNGNVGINITNPGAYRLNVNGDTNITGALNVTGTITGGGAYTGTINAANVSSGAFASNTGLGNFSFPGNVGIGTTDPIYKLDLAGKERIQSTDWYGLTFDTGVADYLIGRGVANTLTFHVPTGSKFGFYSSGADLLHSIDAGTGQTYFKGNVGIGTTNPLAKLHVGSTITTYNDISTSAIFTSSATGVAYPLTIANPASQAVNNSARISFDFGTSWSATSYVGAIIENTDTAGTGLQFGTYNGGLNEIMRISSLGNVGINTTTPTEAKLVINAGAGMALKAYGNAVFTGTVQTQTGSDFAEEFATPYDLEAGTVVVMDEAGYKSVKPSISSYDKTVVGIVSNNPSIIAGRVESKYTAIIAMMGVVKVKVTGDNGKIYKGDMLTTADREGYAMKADNSKPGTIIGKALENLSDKTGEINVLVNLQ